MSPITIKQVYGQDGSFKHLELWQGQQHIEISLADATLDVQKMSYKWAYLKQLIDEQQKKINNAS